MENYFIKTYNFLVLLTIIFLVSGCEKVDLNEINNLNGNKITLIGHGGSGFESPQNPLPHDSYSSLIKAVEAYGLEMVEADVQMSADGAIFMYHDNTLESKTDCFGCLFFKDSEVLKNCRYRSSLRSNLFLNEKLNEVETVLAKFAERAVKPIVIFDIKLALPECGDFDYNNYRQRFVDEIVRLVTLYDATDWCIVESDRFDFLLTLKDQLPEIKLSFIASTRTDEMIINVVNNGIYMISSHKDLITGAFIQSIHDNGLRVALYGVKTRSGAVEAINKSPDFIYTDNIILLLEILR
jgi:glycerophosphoryl diester phosphodiesterase